MFFWKTAPQEEPVETWHFRGQCYEWNPDTYDPDEYDNPVAETLFDPSFESALTSVHGEFDTTWSDTFVEPFMKEIFVHGCVYWVCLLLFILCTSFFVTCVGGPSPAVLFPTALVLIGLSIAHEARMLSYKQTYFNIRDIYAPARLATGLDTLFLQYGFSALKQLSLATSGLLIPQIFTCGDRVASRYSQLWQDSVVRIWAVPLFEHAQFGYWAIGVYVVTVIFMQGIRGFRAWYGKFDGLAADAEEIADWAGMVALSSAFRTLNKFDIQDQAQMGAPEAIMRTREGERALLNKIFNNIITVNVPQIYISVTLVQLTLDLKSTYGQALVAVTSLMSIASVIKGAWPGVKLIMDDYRWRGRLMFAVTLLIAILATCKLAGAYICEPHLPAFFPPHCIHGAS